jgi:exonuclease SbcD
MRIALSADLHLTTRAEHPERYLALVNILDQMIEAGIRLLIIAGDAFDASLSNFSDFEAVCAARSDAGIRIIVLPGNHDEGLAEGAIAAENVHLVTETRLMHLNDTAPLLLMIPFKGGISMGEAIQAFGARLPAGDWALIGHGDWSDGLRQPNPYEPGVYMPFTRRDIDIYQPAEVFLGHVHKPLDAGNLHYPGSPCPLDIGETGPRRFLIYDTSSRRVESRAVANPVIYFDEAFITLPVEDEHSFVQRAVEARLSAWGLDPGDRGKVRVRVSVSGYSRDRRALRQAFEEAFGGYEFYAGQAPDISAVSIAHDPEGDAIAQLVWSQLEDLEWPETEREPGRGEILRAALKAIYRT